MELITKTRLNIKNKQPRFLGFHCKRIHESEIKTVMYQVLLIYFSNTVKKIEPVSVVGGYGDMVYKARFDGILLCNY